MRQINKAAAKSSRLLRCDLGVPAGSSPRPPPVAPDLPGHGLSGAVDYRGVDLRKKFVVDATAILDELEIDQAAVVGNSLRGMYALWLALAAPERVTRVAIVGVPGIALRTHADLGLALLGVPVLNRFLLRLPSNPKRTRAMLTPSLGKPASQAADRELFEIHYLAGRRPEVALAHDDAGTRSPLEDTSTRMGRSGRGTRQPRDAYPFSGRR